MKSKISSLPTPRQAGIADLETIAALWTAASTWIGTQGSDQWQYPIREDHLRQHIHDGVVYVCEDEDGAFATVTVDHSSAPGLWPDLSSAPACYIHRLVVARTYSGQGVGAAVLDWVAERALSHGHDLLRLDAWTTNERLHDHYEALGFTLVHLVEESISGACFEKRVPK